jgi:hypothetical protein
MTRPSKRSIASRKGSKASALKRQKIASSRGLEAPPTSGLSEICSGSAEIQAGSLNTDARESCEWESDRAFAEKAYRSHRREARRIVV